MGKKKITICLDEDTAEFLNMAKADHLSADMSGFINSLIRQERFRQGFPAYQGTAGLPGAIISLASKLLQKNGAQLPNQDKAQL